MNRSTIASSLLLSILAACAAEGPPEGRPEGTKEGRLSAAEQGVGRRGSTLHQGEWLNVGDYLTVTVANEPSFAILQGDGSLVLYRGTGPGDNRGYVWGTGQPRAGIRGPYQLRLEGSGYPQPDLAITEDGNGCYVWSSPEGLWAASWINFCRSH